MIDPIVKLATSRHVNDLIALVKEAHQEEATLPLKLDESAVFEMILRALSGGAVIGVIANDTEIESACFLEIAKPWYAGNPVLIGLLFYTRPEYRKSINSKHLLLWARSQAQRLNIPLQIEAPAGDNSKPKISLFERVLGSTPAGLSFVHEPRPDAPAEQGDIEVRPAQPSEEEEVLDVARELARENAAHATDESMAIPLIHAALEGDGIIGVIRPKREIEGLIFLRISNPWFSQELFLDEYVAFVRAPYRKSNNAKSLIQFAKRQSDRLDLPLRVGIISKIELARKEALYKRLLGSDASTFHFLYRPH